MPEFDKSADEMIEPGHYFAVVVSISHVGTQDYTFRSDDGTVIQPEQKSICVFELHKRKRSVLMRDGRPFVGNFEFATKLSPKSKMGKFYKTCLGRDWQERFPGSTVHTNAILGALFKVQAIREVSKRTGEAYTKFIDPMPLDPDEDSEVRLTPFHDLIEFDFQQDDPDDPAFKQIPQWIRNKAKASHELRGNYRAPADPWNGGTDPDLEDYPQAEAPAKASRGSRRDYD